MTSNAELFGRFQALRTLPAALLRGLWPVAISVAAALPVAALAAIVLATAACTASSKRAPSWSATVDTLENGVVRIGYDPPPPDLPAWRLTEELRIGGPDVSGAASFARIKGLQVLASGDIVVLDAIARKVRVFDPAGQHLATFGGEGDGPGEFQEPFGIMQDASGQLWIPDYHAARMTVLDTRSGFRESFPLRLTRRGSLWAGAMTRDGLILVPGVTLGSPRENVLLVHDQEMHVVDSLALPDDPPVDRKDPPGAYYWELPDGRAMGYVGIPGFPFGVRRFDREGGIWSSDPGDFEYRIKHWQPGADTLLRLEVHRETVSIPESERDSVISALRAQLKERGAAAQDWSKVPRQRPALRSLSLSDDGILWVETLLADGSTLFDRFGPDGSYRGSVYANLRLATDIPLIIRGDRLWGVATDEFDVPYVVRARIEPSA